MCGENDDERELIKKLGDSEHAEGLSEAFQSIVDEPIPPRLAALIRKLRELEID